MIALAAVGASLAGCGGHASTSSRAYRPKPTAACLRAHGYQIIRVAESKPTAANRNSTGIVYAVVTKRKVAVLFHMRVTRPLVGALLTLLGLSVILRNPNRHVFISAGVCLVFCAWFYACVLGCKFLGTNDYVSPPLAAWLPVLIFGPITLASFDAIHT